MEGKHYGQSVSALRLALELAANGAVELVAPAPDAQNYAEFQALAEALVHAKEGGLVYEVNVERSRARETFENVKRVVISGGLTPRGRLAYEQSQAKPSAAEPNATVREHKEPEIFQLRPTFAGVSIDLKALWRKWKAKK